MRQGRRKAGPGRRTVPPAGAGVPVPPPVALRVAPADSTG
ncbi:hypothetical protein Ae168Ps1_1530c [Pseudonocardia sp. Ae168_Ps1]|nr:hypothetical protein Ae150APs1_1525c [Pseudonocardia sp. Ae150A_Ps1]OLL79124.1 hypothetical protein Ae168Ps1_1530c [Pseudonocardia sp. Ae168_Ps1]OLL86739.1 hypothetical protein Ae263Ps1_3794 [Pseudonocardia sp. Ae263_Ps1]OLL93216.1 hypothetical protein Ae356Ps1_3113c [Pseudonocardia sp. Ae356_Ps1]